MAINTRQGSGFTNIQRVVQANQNNRLGSTIGSGISGQANTYNQQAQKQQQSFEEEKKKNALNTDDNASAVKQGIESAKSGQAIDSDKQNKFAAFRAGQYQGPQGLGNIQSLQSKAQQAENLGKATQSTEGRQGLLQKFAGKGQYTQGQQRLDNLLLGQTGNQNLQQARKSTFGLTQDIQNKQNVAQQQAQQQAQANQAFSQDVLKQLSGASGEVNQGVQDIINQRQQERQAAADLAQETKKKLDLASQLGLDKSGLTIQDMTRLGLSNDTFADDINFGALKNIIQDPTSGDLVVDPTKVMSEQQKNALLSLQGLAGQQAADVGLNKFGVNKDTQVGGYQDLNLFDSSQGYKALGERANQFTAEQNRLNQFIDDLSSNLMFNKDRPDVYNQRRQSQMISSGLSDREAQTRDQLANEDRMASQISKEEANKVARELADSNFIYDQGSSRSFLKDFYAKKLGLNEQQAQVLADNAINSGDLRHNIAHKKDYLKDPRFRRLKDVIK